MVQEAARPRRPTIRHCIGVRSCASSMRTWANGSSSMRCVGGVQARPVGAYSRSEAVVSSSRSPPRSVGVLVGPRPRRSADVAEGVAQLVDERDVLDRRSSPPQDLSSSPWSSVADHAVADAGEELGSRSQPSTVARRAAATSRPRTRRRRRCGAARRRTPRGRARGRARRGPGATARRAAPAPPAAPGGCAGPGVSSWRRILAEVRRSSTRLSSR